MSDYIEFVKTGDTGKTEIFEVRSKHGGEAYLGVIKWYSAWRRYVLFAGTGTVWSPGCLDTIITFLNGLMATKAAAKKCPSGVHNYTVVDDILMRNATCDNCGKPYNELDVPADPPPAEPDTWESMG